MKGMVVFDSSHGNTKVIASTIGKTLRDAGMEVDTIYVKRVKNLSPGDCDFLVLGSPTKFGTMSFAFRRLLGKIKEKDWANKPFVAFDTENPENIERKEGSAAEKIAEKLEEKQMIQLLPVLKSVVLGMKGPLYEGEIERAQQYAKTLALELK